MSITALYLYISHGVSRGRDTYGYNIVSLQDAETGKRYRCNGGGYDMVGTVVGEWLQTRFQDRLQGIKERAHVTYDFSQSPRLRTENKDGLYGLANLINIQKPNKKTGDVDRLALDGACGINSMMRVAREIGVHIRYLPCIGRRRSSPGFQVTIYADREELEREVGC
jgi:hypothetical protein